MSRSCVLTHASGVSSHVCVDARVACLNTHAHLRAVFRVSAQKRVFLHSDLHYWSSVVPHAFFPFPHMCANTPLFVSTHRIHVPDGRVRGKINPAHVPHGSRMRRRGGCTSHARGDSGQRVPVDLGRFARALAVLWTVCPGAYLGMAHTSPHPPPHHDIKPYLPPTHTRHTTPHHVYVVADRERHTVPICGLHVPSARGGTGRTGTSHQHLVEPHATAMPLPHASARARLFGPPWLAGAV